MSLPDFPTYFQSLWGYDPFPWQVRLVLQVCKEGRWPEWVTLPTGTGKTTCLDIAIYHLATQADLPLSERNAPVRIVFAVNRRIVVDEAYDRVKVIANKLKDALEDSSDPLHTIASALKNLAQDEMASPLDVYPLRGGTFTDHSWARTPSQPLVLTTTLDQLGSRLLFRGYGVSEYARPVHAALLANDALLILDEAHTSKPFSQTLQAISKLRQKAAKDLGTPFHSVQLTATPPADAELPFTLNSDDESNSVISARIRATKPTTIVKVDGAKGASRHAKMAGVIADETTKHLAQGTRHILIVVNRVATAEEVFAKLCPKGKKGHNAEVRLLTGRLRPLDRDHLIQNINTWLKPEDGEAEPEASLVLVATQCIEVGADYDFDALLSELAPLDSLRQRFGRLNRTGRTDIVACGMIFAPEEALDTNKPDPLYGDCLPAVWDFLSSIEELDFGIVPLDEKLPKGDAIGPLLAPSADAPILMPTHLDILCQTSPAPHAEPDPVLYIHGTQRSFPEVNVIIRSDIGIEQDAKLIIESVPPLPTEAATMPLYLVQQLLADSAKVKDESGDVPDDLSIGKTPNVKVTNSAWVYRNGEAALLKNTKDLRSGDFLIVPHTLESLVGKVTTESDPARLDQFERAHIVARDKLCIRFHRQTLRELEKGLDSENKKQNWRALTQPLFESDADANDVKFSIPDWKKAISAIAAFLSENLDAAHSQKEIWRQASLVKGEWLITPMKGEKFIGVILKAKERLGMTNWPVAADELRSTSTVADEAISLSDHNAGVGLRAARNGKGLEESFVRALKDAGLWHDHGKLDPRFQALLYGCSLYAVGNRAAIAKSGDGFRTPAMIRFYIEQSGLPGGFRHELLSALIVAQTKIGSDYPERDLLLHLIASHHGRCRALAPIVRDTEPEPFDVEVGEETFTFAGADCPLAHFEHGVARRFWTLTRRFGWWGLPYLETILRLADQRESANPSITQVP